MVFIRLSDLSHPYSVFDLITAAKPTILPSEVSLWDLPSMGYAEIVDGPQPAFDSITQIVVPGAVLQLAGVWTQPYIAQDLPADQAEANMLAAIQQADYDINNNVMSYLDSVARDRSGYTGVESAALRAAWSGAYQAEGVAYGQWLDACRDHCKAVMVAVRARTRAIPTYEDIIAELPALTLPGTAT